VNSKKTPKLNEGKPNSGSISPWRLDHIQNIGHALTETARRLPDQIAVACPSSPRPTKLKVQPGQKLAYDRITFSQLEDRSGMGRKNMINCLAAAKPAAMVGIRKAHLARLVFRKKLGACRINLSTNGWFPGCQRTDQLQGIEPPTAEQIVAANDCDRESPAAIIFTTGSTGPPKGVLYRHRNFIEQSQQIRDYFSLQPGAVDVSGCVANKVSLPKIKSVFTAGAPAPPDVLSRVKSVIAEDGDVYTPYGATEALPVACNAASVVISETAARTNDGHGTCVGHKFSEIQWQVIEISDEPLEKIDQVTPVAMGEIGELIVKGPVVTDQYVTRIEANAQHKITDGNSFWHRMGDVGYLDDQERFWFCGRKGHRVRTPSGTMFTIPCEAISNLHEKIYRSALVGVGPTGSETPVMIAWAEQQLTPPS